MGNGKDDMALNNIFNICAGINGNIDTPYTPNINSTNILKLSMKYGNDELVIANCMLLLTTVCAIAHRFSGRDMDAALKSLATLTALSCDARNVDSDTMTKAADDLKKLCLDETEADIQEMKS